MTKNKVSDRVKGDKTKMFFVNKKIFESGDNFIEIFDNKEQAEKEDTQSLENTSNIAKNIINELINFPIDQEIYQYLCSLPGIS